MNLRQLAQKFCIPVGLSLNFCGVALAEEPTSRIQPVVSAPRFFNQSGIVLGGFLETPQYRTALRYHGDGFGISAMYLQHIFGMWSGGLQLRWSEWHGVVGTKDEGHVVSPISFYSKLEAAPDWWGVATPITNFLRIFGNAGLGYVQFYQRQALPTGRSKLEPSDLTFTIGVGLKASFPAGMGLRLSVERWRSLRTFSYSAYQIQLEAALGDFFGW